MPSLCQLDAYVVFLEFSDELFLCLIFISEYTS